MNSNILTYIDFRMKSLGIKDYSLKHEVVDINPVKLINNIEAYNEYYFLLSISLETTIILSDEKYFRADLDNMNSEYLFMNEFSGLIEIHLPKLKPTKLEFIRVIPI